MTSLSRRRFLKTAAAVSTTFPLFTVAGTQASGRVIGANDTIRVGVAGINGRGKSHISEFSDLENVQVTHLIDPDANLFDSRASMIEEKSKNRPKCFKDIREALDDKNLDAVSVATCNHWHSLDHDLGLPGRQGCLRREADQSQRLRGTQCVEAAKKYGRIVQHGTQQRSSEGRAGEMAAMQSGKYGKLLVSKGYCCKPRWSIGIKRNHGAAERLRLQCLAGPGSRTALPRQSASLQLALVLGLRQRGYREPGRARNGRRPLGNRRRHLAHQGLESGRSLPARTKRTRARRPTCSCRFTSSVICCWSSKRADS